MQIDKLPTFVNESSWNFDKIVFMVDIRIIIRTKEMLKITPKELCYIIC